MLYDTHNKSLKNGSLIAKVYFLLLEKPKTVSEISKLIYGKVQLAHINKTMKTLRDKKYIEEKYSSLKDKLENNLDPRARFWKANYKPIINFIVDATELRKIERKGGRSKNKKGITKEEKEVLKLIFNSKYFSNFYNQEFLKAQESIGETVDYNGFFLSETPIRFFAFIVEELSATKKEFNLITNFNVNEKDILKEGDFDRFLEKKNKLINPKIKKSIDERISTTKKILGNYKETNITIDYYMKNYGCFFIPFDLANKLLTIGRNSSIRDAIRLSIQDIT